MKILYVTTISLTMNTFFKPHIEMLVSAGNHVDIVCNFKDLPLDPFYFKLGCNAFQVDFSRSVLSPINIKAFVQLKKVVKSGGYDIVHCHTPNASVISRFVCRKLRKEQGLKVFYTAHGFHFYKGAPFINWMLFYPIEKLCSRFTDKIVTINYEDFNLAKDRFHSKEVYHIPGVGIDLSKFHDIQVDISAKRKEIGIPETAFFLLSVGELNKNKNHQIIIRALAELNDPDVHYAIAGIGDEREALFNLAQQLNVGEQLHFLGYRKDIPELNYVADVFCFPSLREGLGLAAIEAMACGTPVIVADNRGSRSFVQAPDNGLMCSNDSVKEYADAISCLMNDCELRSVVAQRAKDTARGYSIHNVLLKLRTIYFGDSA